MVKFFSICLVVLLLCSCHSRRKEIARIVEEWKNKEVIFPDPLLVKVQGRDTILPDFQERKYKILNYIDTSGCTECRMKLAEWQLLKQEIDSLGYDVDILFVAWVHNYDELEILQRANRCQLPFLYDPQGDMQKINQFPAEPAFQTFLLDSLNRVLLIGSPVENDKIWTLYQRSLSSLNSGIPGRTFCPNIGYLYDSLVRPNLPDENTLNRRKRDKRSVPESLAGHFEHIAVKFVSDNGSRSQ